MGIAKDGKEFDIDNIDEDKNENEVELIQFLRPNGQRRRMLAQVGKELAQKADNLILSCEELSTGQIVLYARRKGESEEKEISEFAINGEGEKSPTNMLIKLIERIGERPIE